MREARGEIIKKNIYNNKKVYKKTDNNETDGVSDMSELVFGGGGIHTRAD